MSCGAGHRLNLDPVMLWLWLWLWHRLAAAAQIRDLAWELPYASGATLKRKTNKQQQKTLNPKTEEYMLLHT